MVDDVWRADGDKCTLLNVSCIAIRNRSTNHEEGNNGSGYCKDCGADLKASQRCKYCGEIHTGTFGWLIKFFHSILAIFKR